MLNISSNLSGVPAYATIPKFMLTALPLFPCVSLCLSLFGPSIQETRLYRSSIVISNGQTETRAWY